MFLDTFVNLFTLLFVVRQLKFWTDSDVIFRVDYLWADLKRVDFEGRLPRGILDTRTIPFDLE